MSLQHQSSPELVEGLSEILVSAEEIQQRVGELGQAI
jgi:hypothetical protein